MDSGIPSSGSTRLENARTSHFITNCASVLAARGIIGARDARRLRMLVHDFHHAEGAEGSRRLWTHLVSEPDDAVIALCSWFGPKSLARNLLNQHLLFHCDELLRRLASDGADALATSKLLFNRSVTVFVDGTPHATRLLPTLLLDYAARLRTTIELLQPIRSRLQAMHCYSPPGDPRKADEVATTLGFTTWYDGSFPTSEYREILSHMTMAFESFGGVAKELGDTAAGSSAQTRQLYGGIMDQTRLLRDRVEPESESLIDWDHYVFSVASAAAELNSLCAQLSQQSKAIVKSANFDQEAKALLNLQAQGLKTELIRQGTPAKKADRAVAALGEYCEFHRINPNSLIENELEKIDPAFQRHVRTWLVERERRELAERAEIKKKAVEKSRQHETFFRSTLAALTGLLFCFLVSTGCGVKTDPVSELIEYRPGIPFLRPVEAAKPTNHTTLHHGDTRESSSQTVSSSQGSVDRPHHTNDEQR